MRSTVFTTPTLSRPWYGRWRPSNQLGGRTRANTSPTKHSSAGRWPRAAWIGVQNRSNCAALSATPPCSRSVRWMSLTKTSSGRSPMLPRYRRTVVKGTMTAREGDSLLEQLEGHPDLATALAHTPRVERWPYRLVAAIVWCAVGLACVVGVADQSVRVPMLVIAAILAVFG